VKTANGLCELVEIEQYLKSAIWHPELTKVPMRCFKLLETVQSAVTHSFDPADSSIPPERCPVAKTLTSR